MESYPRYLITIYIYLALRYHKHIKKMCQVKGEWE